MEKLSKITSKDIRNFCLISHGGAGKSTLTEMLLYNSGVIEQPGSVDNGNSHSDYSAVEKDHKHSVHNSYFSFEWKNKLFHFVDTPGYADFRSEVVSALKMVESAVLLVDATAGIEVNTGYVWQLADKYYTDVNNLDKKLKSKDNQYVRPAEVDLLSLLETGELDYLFIYRSVAQQHKMGDQKHDIEYVILPNKINLKTSEYSDFYKNAKVEVSGKKPGETITKTGAPMVYGITIPSNAENKELAKKFLQFLFSEKGIKIMEDNGQPFIKPPVITGKTDKVPEEIKNQISQIK